MDRQPVRVGVIGVGALGRHHARLYRQCPGAELVGIYDNDPQAARAVALELGTCAYPSEAALAADCVGLSVAVPTDRHCEVVTRLLSQRKHVLVEKPIAQTVAEARRLVAAAARHHLVLQVGHVERFNPVLACLSDVPGQPLFIEAHRLAPYPPPRPGLRPRGTEVSVVLDLMIHDIDVILDLVRSPVTRIDAVGLPVLSETEDIANARLAFASGAVANITASRISQERLRKIRVFKSNAYLSLDYQERKGEIATRVGPQITRTPVPVDDTNALLQELEDFCRCVRTAQETRQLTQPRVSGEQGLAALRVAERILRRITAARRRA